jgi:hypothetical protein
MEEVVRLDKDVLGVTLLVTAQQVVIFGVFKVVSRKTANPTIKMRAMTMSVAAPRDTALLEFDNVKFRD